MGGIGRELSFSGKPAGHAIRGARDLLKDQVNFFNSRGRHLRAGGSRSQLFGSGSQVDKRRGNAARDPHGDPHRHQNSYDNRQDFRP